MGNLTRDPEIRYVGSGAAVVKFTLAVNRRSKEKDETDYIDIVAWDKLAETCNTYFRKGMSCLVEGRLSIRSYDDKEGNKRKATEVVANVMQMLGRKAEGDAGAPAGAQSQGAGGSYSRGNDSYNENDGDGGLDDEIPFD